MTVDEGLVEVVGDTAEVLGEVLSSTGAEPGSAQPRFARIKTTQQGGLWYVITG